MSFYNPYSSKPDYGSGFMDLAQLFLMYKMMMGKKNGQESIPPEIPVGLGQPTGGMRQVGNGRTDAMSSGQSPMMPDQNSLQNIFRLMSFMGGPLGR